ncbi:hypothetical protein Tco_0782182 [Tanacetum coccineum]
MVIQSDLVDFDVTSYIKVLRIAQDRDVGFGGKAASDLRKKESMKKAFQDMLHGLGGSNPTHAYYNGSSSSKDNEDLS